MDDSFVDFVNSLSRPQTAVFQGLERSSINREI